MGRRLTHSAVVLAVAKGRTPRRVKAENKVESIADNNQAGVYPDISDHVAWRTSLFLYILILNAGPRPCVRRW